MTALAVERPARSARLAATSLEDLRDWLEMRPDDERRPCPLIMAGRRCAGDRCLCADPLLAGARCYVDRKRRTLIVAAIEPISDAEAARWARLTSALRLDARTNDAGNVLTICKER